LTIATARALGVSLLDRRDGLLAGVSAAGAVAASLQVAEQEAAADAPLVDGIPQISVQELKRRLDATEDVFVLDVREPHEVQIVNIGAPLIPLGELPKRLGELAAQKDRDIVMHCKSGGRSQKAALILKNAGFPRVENLAGGILAWAEKIDPTLPKY
jgi:adenylyltransferase/sulfurtransferase